MIQAGTSEVSTPVRTCMEFTAFPVHFVRGISTVWTS